MFGRKSIKGVLVMVLAALFVMAFAYQASAFSAGGSTPFTYTGKIVALDNADKILTVQAGPNDELTFNLNENGAVMKCSMSGSFTDLRIGDLVTVSYFDEGNSTYIANEINFAASGMNRC
jgi:hypothetical protein